MAKVGLDRARVVTIAGQLVTGAVSEHVGMTLEWELSLSS